MDESNFLTTGKFCKTKPQFCLATIKTKFNEKDFMSIPSSSEFFGTNSFSSVRKFNVTDIRIEFPVLHIFRSFIFDYYLQLESHQKVKSKEFLKNKKWKIFSFMRIM